MVKLNVKSGTESLFLYETNLDQPVEELIKELVAIQNGRLKIERICSEFEGLAEHGVSMPQNMQGLTDEQIEELHLEDEWAERCTPAGSEPARLQKDPMSRRCGRAPGPSMAEMLKRTRAEARAMVTRDLVARDVCITSKEVKNAIDILRGATMIVYPMGLPPHDPIKLELENHEDLSGTQASLEVFDDQTATLWFSGRELIRGKKLRDFLGNNEKTKVVLKIQKKGSGAPAREPLMSEEEQKQLMAHFYRKQEEEKKLKAEVEGAEGDVHLDSAWADASALKRQFHGISGDLKFRPKF